MHGNEARTAACRRYTKENLLRVRDSPLVVKPGSLPPLETWVPESRSKGDENDTGRNKGPRRNDALTGASNDAVSGGNDLGSARSGFKPRAGLDRNIVLGPPKMNFASSTKKPSDTSIPADGKISDDGAKSRVNNASDLGLPQLKSTRNLEDQNERGEGGESPRNARIDSQRPRREDGSNRSWIGDSNRFSTDRRRPDSSGSDGRTSSSRPYNDDRANGRYNQQDDVPAWMEIASPLTTTSSTTSIQPSAKVKLEKFSLPADGMDEIAKFRARMKERERAARGEGTADRSIKIETTKAAVSTENSAKDNNGAVIPVNSEAVRNPQEVALGVVDFLALPETGADAILSKRLLAVSSANSSSTPGSGGGAPRFRRFFELEGEPQSATSTTSSIVSTPSLTDSKPDMSTINPIAMLSQRFPDAVVYKPSDAEPKAPVILSEADLLAKFGVGTAVVPVKPSSSINSMHSGNTPLQQSAPYNDDFSRVMQMFSKQIDVGSPHSHPSAPGGAPVELTPGLNSSGWMSDNPTPFQQSLHSTHNSINSIPPIIPQFAPTQQRPPLSMMTSTLPINNMRPSLAQPSPMYGALSSSHVRSGNVYTPQPAHAGLAAMVQAGILAKKSSNSSSRASSFDMDINPLFVQNRQGPGPPLPPPQSIPYMPSNPHIQHYFMHQQQQQQHPYPMNPHVPPPSRPMLNPSLLMDMMHRPPGEISSHLSAGQQPHQPQPQTRPYQSYLPNR